MSKNNKRFIYLSKEFYNDYPQEKFPEIEKKDTRPYIQICVTINGVQFALPLRSHINHKYVVWTDKENRCGIDLTKAVVISDEKYIDTEREPRLRQNEFNALKGKDFFIKSRFENYIKEYKSAKLDTDNIYSQRLRTFSTLQYFEEYIDKIQ